MPFVGTERGKLLVEGRVLPRKVGDLCAMAYTPIIRAWRKSPRWTTVHKTIKPSLSLIESALRKRIKDIVTIHPEITFDPEFDAKYATELAYEVFFGLYVLDYERKKREENGDIE